MPAGCPPALRVSCLLVAFGSNRLYVFDSTSCMRASSLSPLLLAPIAPVFSPLSQLAQELVESCLQPDHTQRPSFRVIEAQLAALLDACT